jgi:bacterioferritin
MAAILNNAALEGMYPFLSGIAERRRRARRHMEAGAVDPIVQLLNEALATELMCVARYRHHGSVLAGIAENVRGEFLKYAGEEQHHADLITERILQLGGRPASQPPRAADIAGGRDEDRAEAEQLADLLEEDLLAERIAIESYREILAFVGSADAATRQLLEAILAVELTHAQDLAGMRNDALRRDRACGATSARLTRIELP